jgi:HD-GYP domain-containing protein (c-di-GMP phosphodiesterase class II)
MEAHVAQSFYFLREIPWAKPPWRHVPDLADGHHEHLDGTGYPRGLKAAEIAPQVRMLTIAGVYDAPTADDRPYKAALFSSRNSRLRGGPPSLVGRVRLWSRL